jgi:hypothetical protein
MNQHNFFSRLRTLGCLCGLILASACGCSLFATNSDDGDFATYAELVFRRQNQLDTRLMMQGDEEQLPDSKSLEAAENTMHQSCRLLNEYAARESGGEDIDLALKLSVKNSIDQCAHSIDQLDALLNSSGFTKK